MGHGRLESQLDGRVLFALRSVVEKEWVIMRCVNRVMGPVGRIARKKKRPLCLRAFEPPSGWKWEGTT